MAWDFTGGFSSSGAGQNNSTAAGWDFSGGFKFDPEKEKKKKDLEQSVQQLADDLFVDASPPDTTSVQTQNPLLEALNSMAAESSTPFISPRMDVVNANLDDYQKSIGDSERQQMEQLADLLPAPEPKEGIYTRMDKAYGGFLPGGVPFQRDEGFPGMENFVGGGPEAPPVFEDDPVMKSLAMGWGDVAQSAGGAAKWMGKEELGNKWVQSGQKLIDANQLTPGTPGEHGTGLSVVRSLPFTASLIPAALAGAAGGTAAAGAAGLGTIGTAIAGGAGATLLSRPFEALAEAGGTYNDALAQGMSEEQAAEAAKSTFLKNLPLAATDFLEIGTAFLGAKFLKKPLGKAIEAALESKFGRNIIDPAIKIAAPVLMEGEEENIQQIIQQQALGDKRGFIEQYMNPTEAQMQARRAGQVMGGALGGVGAIANIQAGQQKQPVQEDKAYTTPPLQKPDIAPVSYSGPVLGNIERPATPRVEPPPATPPDALSGTESGPPSGLPPAGPASGGEVGPAGKAPHMAGIARAAEMPTFKQWAEKEYGDYSDFSKGMMETAKARYDKHITELAEIAKHEVKDIPNEFEKIYYRGEKTGETKKISTGVDSWDNNLFVANSPKSALAYGDKVERIALKKNSKVLIEGSKEYKELAGNKKYKKPLDEYVAVLEKAKEQGYDVVEFSRQTDIGTVILNENSVVRNYLPESTTPPPPLKTGQAGVIVPPPETNVPQMGDKPVEDETSQGQATQKEPWQMTKPELAQQKPGENPAAKQELAGEGAKTTGAQPPVPAVAGNKVKQQAVIVRHPDGDGYAVSAGVDRWISGGGGAFGGGSIGKWNTVEGAIKGTSHLNKKDWDIVVSDELKPGAQQDSSRDTADSIRKAYDAVTKMYMDKYGLSEAPEQPILAAEVADEWGKRQGMKPTQARKSFREAVAKLMEEGTAGDIVIGSVRDVNNSLGRITVGGRDIQLGTVYVRTQKAETGEKTEKPAPEKKKGPTPDRIRNIFRGKRGSVRVEFPDVIHAELFAFPSKLKKAARDGGGNIDHEVKRLKHWLRLGEEDNLAAIAQDYHKGVMDAVKDLPAKSAYKAEKYEKKAAKQGVPGQTAPPSAIMAEGDEVVDKGKIEKQIISSVSIPPRASDVKIEDRGAKGIYVLWRDVYGRGYREFGDMETAKNFASGKAIRFEAPHKAEEVKITSTATKPKQFEPWTERITGEETLTEPITGYHFGFKGKELAATETAFYKEWPKDRTKVYSDTIMVEVPAGTRVRYYGDDEFRVVLNSGMRAWKLKPGWLKQADRPSPQQAGVEKKIRANEQAKPPESEVSDVPAAKYVYDSKGRKWEVLDDTSDRSKIKVRSATGAETWLGRKEVTEKAPESEAKAATESREQPLTPESIAKAYIADKASPEDGSWEKSADGNYAERFIKPLAKRLSAKGWSTVKELKTEHSNIKWMQDKGFVDTAWDKKGTPYYALKGTALPEWLTKSDKESDMAKLPDKGGAAQKKETPTKKSTASIITGKTTTAKTERGTSIEVQYAVVSADDLIASHNTDLTKNEAYPEEIQPRQRERAASEEQINRIAANLEPEFLGESPKASEGAPIVGPDLVVESGNGRVIALKRVFKNKKESAGKYKGWLAENAEKFGIDKEALEKVENPVLVRIRQTEVDRVKFAQEANEQSVASMSATEQAKADATKLTGDILSLFVPSETGEIHRLANADFIRNFMEKVVGPSERGRYVTGDGVLSQEGVTRIKNAIFAKAYGDVTAIATLAESTDNNVKNITNAMLIAAPKLAKVKEGIDSGNLYDLDVSPDIAAAMNKLSHLREMGDTVEGYLGQAALFGQELSDISRDLLKFFDINKRHTKRMANVLKYYADAVTAIGDPKQETMFEKIKPTRAELLLAAVRKVEKENGEANDQTSLFQDQATGSKDGGKHPRKISEGAEAKGQKPYNKTGGRGGKIPGPEVKPEPTATKQPADMQKEALKTEPNSGNVETGKAQALHDWLNKAEQDAWSRLESRKGRLMAGLPMDDLVDYAIIGAAKLARKALNLAEFTASMLEDIKAHFGEEAARKTKPFMPGVYGQAQAMLEMTPDEIEEMISTASKEEGDQDESADSSILDEGTEGSSGGAGGQLSPGTDDDSAGSPGGKSSKAPGRNDTKDTGDVPIQPGPSGGKREESDLQETDTGVAGDKRPRREADGADGSKGGQRRGDGEDAEGSNAGPKGPAYQNYRINEENPVFTGGGKKTRYEANVEALKVMDQVLTEKRQPTIEEQRKLALFSGWGALPEALSNEYGRPKYKDWEKEYYELKEILDDLENKHFSHLRNYRGDLHRNASASTMNAHFTSPDVISVVYQALQQMGFKKGNVLEPSMGTGNFFGMLPGSVASKTKLFGVELDPVTGSIAQLLYPNADIRIMGFQDAQYPDNYFDVAVGNVPFGNYPVSDPKYPAYARQRIHNYFFVKTIDKVKPGGIVAYITSTGTLDAKDNKRSREYISQKANLIGAIRLPGDTFKDNAGTEVTTDILFFQKLRDGELPKGGSWIESTTIEVEGEEVSLSQYYKDNPHMVAGELALSTLYGKKGRIGVKSTSEDIEQTLSEIITEHLPEDIISTRATKEEVELSPELQAILEDMLDGGISKRDGKLYRKVKAKLVEIKTDVKQISHLVDLRDVAKEVLAMQRDSGVSEEDLEAKRKKMKTLYDSYVKKYGNLLQREVRNGKLYGRPQVEKILGISQHVKYKGKNGKECFKTAFITEPETYLLKGLEIETVDVDSKGRQVQSFQSSQVLTKRTYTPAQVVDKVSSASEGLIVSINQLGYVDMEHISKTYGKTEEEIVEELGDMLYKNPSGGWETDDEYLSGNVRKKLAEAEERVSDEPEYQRNIDALKRVIPADIGLSDITVNLGDTWVPIEITQKAVSKILGLREEAFNLQLNPFDNKWNLSRGRGFVDTVEMKAIDAGISSKDALEIVKLALNNGNTVVSYKDKEGKTHVDTESTNMLKAKVAELRSSLKDFIYENNEYIEAVEEEYNKRFNAMVPRDYAKTAEYFTFTNMSPDIKLRPHQKIAIVRALMGGNTLLAHGVGAGKTFVEIAIAMEAKKLGLATKPILVVPNTKLTDFESDAKKLYPGAKILALSDTDFSGENIKRTLALAAANEWDMVIVRHSSFSKIPISPETEIPALQAEVQELEEALSEMKSEKGTSRYSLKAMENRLEKLRVKLEDYRKGKKSYEGLLYFEDMGFDMIVVDEAHEYKNYPLTGRAASIKGLKAGDAAKARDMMIKSGYIKRINGQKRGVVFATGTPISNTMAELFVMFRYLRPDLLQDAGINNFDAWSDVFTNISNVTEISPRGGFKNQFKFKSFVNLPELVTMFREFTDIKMKEDLDLPLPEHEVISVDCDPHPLLKDVMDQVNNLWDEAVKDGTVLRLFNMVRSAPQDIRLVLGKAKNHKGSKVNKVVENVYRIYKEEAKNKGTQLIFLTKGDSSNTGFSLWDEVKGLLIKKGIPAKEIAFVKSGTKEAELQDIYQKINAGTIRVVIGSYGKLGVGVNVQKKLAAEHEIDVPYRPSDIEQAEGRMIRQGNEYYDRGEKVKIYRYVTVGEGKAFSGDAYSWQLIEGKIRDINAVMKGDPKVRTLDAFDADAYDAATLKAMAVGDERWLRKVDLERDIDILKGARNSFMSGLAMARRELSRAREKKSRNETTIQSIEQAENTIKENKAREAERRRIEKERAEADKAAKEKAEGEKDQAEGRKEAVKGKGKKEKPEKEPDLIAIGGKEYDLSEGREALIKADKALKKIIKDYEDNLTQGVDDDIIATYHGVNITYSQEYSKKYLYFAQYIAINVRYREVMKIGRYYASVKKTSEDVFLTEHEGSIIYAFLEEVDNFQKTADQLRAENEQADRDINKYNEILSQPFKKQEEFDKKMAELRELDKALGADAVSVDVSEVDAEERGAEGEDEEAESVQSMVTAHRPVVDVVSPDGLTYGAATNTESLREKADAALNNSRPRQEGPLSGIRSMLDVHSPQKTSIKQVAAGLRIGSTKGIFKEGMTIVDMGGGLWEEGTKYLAEKGITSLVYDPYARTKEHNDKVIETLDKNGGADAAALNNVLNVIPTTEERADVLKYLYQLMKPGGQAVITVYEGNKSGKGAKRLFGDGTSTWQENRRLASYEEEIRKALPGAELEKRFGAFILTKPVAEKKAWKAVRNRVGKVVGADTYIHKSALDVLTESQQNQVKAAQKSIPADFGGYEVIKVSKDGSASFIKSPDWDTAPEPRVGDSVKISPDKSPSISKGRDKNWQIYHHKWMFVKDDYAGFDVEESKARSEEWKNSGIPEAKDLTRIGNNDYWQEHVASKLGGKSPKESARAREKVQGMANPVQPPKGKGAPAKDTIRRKDIIRFLNAKLAPIRTGRFRGKALGIFKVKPEVIRTRLANDLPTISHEIGHYLDKRLELSNNHAYDQELITLGQPQSTKKYTKEQVREEGIAEFIRLYLTDPQQAKQEAPNYFAAFEDVLDIHEDIKDILLTAQRDIELWYSQPAEARVAGAISVDENNARKMSLDRLYSLTVDELDPLKRFTEEIGGKDAPVDKNPFLRAWLARGWNGKAETLLHYGVMGKNGKKIGKSLDEVLAPVKDELDGFRNYAVAKHSLEVTAQGKHTGILDADAQEVVDNAPAKYQDVLEDLVEYQDALLNLLVESGVMKAESVTTMREMYPNYVPFYRVFDEDVNTVAAYMSKGGFANLRNPVKAMKGSMRDIVDPLESIIKNTYQFVNIAERNSVGRAIVELAEGKEGMGRFVEKVDAMHNVAKENILTVYRDGKAEKYQLDPDLYRATLALDREASNILIKILSYPASWLRAGATLSPDFMVRNPIRDQFSAFINSKYGYVPGIDLVKGIFHAIKKDELYWQYQNSGAAHSSLVAIDRDYLQKDIRKFFKEKTTKEKIVAVVNPGTYIEMLRALSELGEYGTRLGEFAKGVKKGASFEEAALSARDMTLDFGRVGSHMKHANRVIAFMNATIQGSDKIVRQFKANPKGSIIKTAAAITLPSIILFLLNHDDDRYKELPQWQKDMFWIVLTKDHIFRIPKPFELGILFGTVPERALAWALDKDPKAFRELGKTLKDAITPGYIPTAMLPIIEVWANKSFFTSRPIVPEREKKLDPRYQFGPYTTETTKAIGNLLNWSPRKIESFLRGYTGGLGLYTIKLIEGIGEVTGLMSNKNKPALAVADYPVIKSFMVKQYASPQSVEDFYAELNELEKKYSSTKQTKQLLINQEEYDRLKLMRKVADILSEIRKAEREIQSSKELTPAQKKRALENADKLTANVARAAMGKGAVK